jgi:transposase
LAVLETAYASLQQALVRAEAEREEYRQLYVLLREENEKLKRGLLGQKAERLSRDDRPLALALLDMLLGEQSGAAIPETQTVREHERRKPPGRKPLPEHLPRVEIELVPLDVQREGLKHFERIGEEVSEVLERRPASAVVVRVIRPKFVPKDRLRNAPTPVLIAAPAELPIERGLAGPGLLADTVVRRWQDHQPLHRLEGIYARDGIALARSTVCGWHEELAALARPVVEAMREDAFRQPYLCTDATGVLVQAKEKCRTGHFWVLVAPPLHVLFGYSPRHDSAGVDRLLAGYQGYLVADAHGRLSTTTSSRTAQSSKSAASRTRGATSTRPSAPRPLATASPTSRQAVRQEQSRPLGDRFFAGGDALVDGVLDETPLAKAIGYARNQREALRRFLDDGRLPLHNNASELPLRRQVIGRRNGLFVGSADAAEVNTTFVSLLASCGLHRIAPWAYLRDLFCLLPGWPRRRVLDLAPAYWKQPLEDQDASSGWPPILSAPPSSPSTARTATRDSRRRGPRQPRGSSNGYISSARRPARDRAAGPSRPRRPDHARRAPARGRPHARRARPRPAYRRRCAPCASGTRSPRCDRRAAAAPR